MTAAAELFELSENQAESLANKAGLSLCAHENAIAKSLMNCGKNKRRLIYHMAVSERMVQYYIAGKEPTKQALIAIAIILEFSEDEIDTLLKKYGYCLSKSLPSDAIVRWFLQNSSNCSPEKLLYLINEVLDSFNFPMLMTKQINRND